MAVAKQAVEDPIRMAGTNHDREGETAPPPARPRPATSRETRLAEALRANLRRRKVQARDRVEVGAADEGEA